MYFSKRRASAVVVAAVLAACEAVSAQKMHQGTQLVVVNQGSTWATMAATAYVDGASAATSTSAATATATAEPAALAPAATATSLTDGFNLPVKIAMQSVAAEASATSAVADQSGYASGEVSGASQLVTTAFSALSAVGVALLTSLL
ncbi:hypothetical protein BC831DRAFT_468453 [Entophlyctis helioformis]|nr:hypothetical protein BC831DRAFT_468453 [Entophlyctis helioformis]